MDITQQLIEEVCDGNPGAFTVVKELGWFSRWYEFLQYLSRKGIVGAKLWELYKDTYNQDSNKLGRYLDNCLAEDKEFKHFRQQEEKVHFNFYKLMD